MMAAGSIGFTGGGNAGRATGCCCTLGALGSKHIFIFYPPSGIMFTLASATSCSTRARTSRRWTKTLYCPAS